MEKKQKTRLPKQKYPITEAILLSFIENAVKFQLPTEGIHKPEMWKTKDAWGVTYKVLCNVGTLKLKQKTSTYDVVTLKWAGRKDVLIPQKGYDPFVKTIDVGETALFRKKLADILNAK